MIKTIRKIFNNTVLTLIMLTTIASMFPLFAAASPQLIVWGAANSAADHVNIRSGPGLGYEVLAQAMRDDPIIIIERTTSEWYYINFNGFIGYVSVPLLDRPRTAANFDAAGKVTGTDVNMRAKPDRTADALAVCQAGDAVGIIGVNEGWYKVTFKGKTGYIRSDLVEVTSMGEQPQQQPQQQEPSVLSASDSRIIGTLTGNNINLRERPSTSARILGTYPLGKTVIVHGIENNWYKVDCDGITGYMHPNYVNPSSKPPNIASYTGDVKVPASASVAGTYVKPPETPPPYNASLSQKIVDLALTFKGAKYVYAGKSPSGFDCSGFIYYLYGQYGINLSRSASGQYKDNGKHIAFADLLPGDIVFTSGNGGVSATHVGLYIGDNQMIHASNPRSGVIISTIGKNGTYYGTKLFGAKRIA